MGAANEKGWENLWQHPRRSDVGSRKVGSAKQPQSTPKSKWGVDSDEKMAKTTAGRVEPGVPHDRREGGQHNAPKGVVCQRNSKQSRAVQVIEPRGLVGDGPKDRLPGTKEQ